ncbi:MAG: zinc finger, RING-type domain-containing protein [Thermoplasmata archaeon]
MEEGDMGDPIGEEQLPPKAEELPQIMVSVIKPFKPSPRVARIVRQGKCYYHPAKPASYICSSCGKSICFACAKNLGDVFFCPQCAPLETPRPPHPTPREEESALNWYRALFTIGVILVIIGLLFVFMFWPLTSISAAEFQNLQEQYLRNGGHNFEGYNPQDVIVIRDTIIRMETDFDPGRFGVITMLWFESTGKDDTDFWISFDGDLKKDYHVGDIVSLTLHVGEDSRTHDEVIRELNNNLPDISNIDHTFSVNFVFYAMIIFGVFLVLIYVLFTRKVKRAKIPKTATYLEKGVEEGITEGESSAK